MILGRICWRFWKGGRRESNRNSLVYDTRCLMAFDLVPRFCLSDQGTGDCPDLSCCGWDARMNSDGCAFDLRGPYIPRFRLRVAGSEQV
jgi:hypothetical protein